LARIEHGSIDVGGATIAYDAVGAGPPLVLIHGLSGSGRWFAHNVATLAERFRVYTVDLVGFGRSAGGLTAARGRPRFRLDQAADQLVTVFDVLGIERVSLVGHSMGGLIAAALAAEHPERVERLVLVDAAVLPTPNDRRFDRRAWGVMRSLPRTPRQLGWTIAGDALRAGSLGLGRAIRQLLGVDWTDKVRRIQSPTLIVWGELDTIVPPEVGRRLALDVPGARLVTLDGCGHVPMWERPEAFNTAVLAFLVGEETP
jgi:pimeloyl-ACP methyl ester carboxylesterase